MNGGTTSEQGPPKGVHVVVVTVLLEPKCSGFLNCDFGESLWMTFVLEPAL